jgi:hypothetical protein
MKNLPTDDDDLHKPEHEPYKRHHMDWRTLLEQEVAENFEDEEDDETLQRSGG